MRPTLVAALTAVIFFAGLSLAALHDRFKIKIELIRLQAKCQGLNK